MTADNNTFEAGILPGGMRSRDEIRILICYLLKSVKKPVKKDIITEALQSEALANYFEASSCFDDLYNNKNIKKDGEGYSLTESGTLIAEQLETEVAYSVKEKAFLCVMSLIEQEKLDRENSVKISKTANGYTVSCVISDRDIRLYSFELYVPDYEQARLVKRNFRKNSKTTIS